MFDDGGFMCKVDTISNFPVPIPNEFIKNKLESLLIEIIENNDNLQQIMLLNLIVCKLYNLTYLEYSIINEYTKISEEFFNEYLID